MRIVEDNMAVTSSRSEDGRRLDGEEEMMYLMTVDVVVGVTQQIITPRLCHYDLFFLQVYAAAVAQ